MLHYRNHNYHYILRHRAAAPAEGEGEVDPVRVHGTQQDLQRSGGSAYTHTHTHTHTQTDRETERQRDRDRDRDTHTQYALHDRIRREIARCCSERTGRTTPAAVRLASTMLTHAFYDNNELQYGMMRYNLESTAVRELSESPLEWRDSDGVTRMG